MGDTDAMGKVQEVRGPGVVGNQPVLAPGQSFEYTSGCPLTVPFGSMHGTYQMIDDRNEHFDVEIAPFVLAEPKPESIRHIAYGRLCSWLSKYSN